MNYIDQLCKNYEMQVNLRWDPGLSGPQRVWMAVYPADLERKIRFRLRVFEEATRRSGHGWKHVDLTTAFSKWMGNHEYRGSYFGNPDALGPALEDFELYLSDRMRESLQGDGVDATTLVAISGVGSLLGFVRASKLLEDIAAWIPGRLLVLFPGEMEGSNYRLLNVRDGWNYLAIPITGLVGR